LLEGREPSQLVREREHELAHRHVRNHAIHEVRRAVRHAPTTAARADAARLARKCDKEIVATTVTSKPRKSVREDATTQVRAKLRLHVARKRALVGLPRLRQERFEMLPHDAIEHRLRGTARLVGTGEARHALQRMRGGMPTGGASRFKRLASWPAGADRFDLAPVTPAPPAEIGPS